MPWKFNPFTGSLDQTGSGGGGGSAFFAGEVSTYADLPLDGTAALNSRWLVRSNSGTWPFSSYKQAGIYIRTATGGTDRDADYTLTDTSFHDVMSDDAFLLFDDGDATKTAQFQLSGITAGTNRVVSLPDKNITLDDSGDSRDPNAHAASHAAAGSDPVFDQDLNTTDNVQFGQVEAPTFVAQGVGDLVQFDATGIIFAGVAAANTRTDLGLGTAATADIGTGAGEVAAGDHTHTAADLDSQTASNGHVLTADGSGGSSFQALPASGVSAVGSSVSDILSVSGSDLVADDPNADRLVFWDDSASKLTHLEVGSGLSISGTTITATASGGSKTYAVFTSEHNQPPSSAFATLDTRNSIAVLDFDDATDESAVFVGIIPEGASLGSGLKIRLHWMATTATSGNCVWDVSLERMTTDLDSDSFDTIASGTAAANGTSGILTVTEITLTTIDSVTAGDGYRLKVTRDANNASDTMSGDAELVVVEVRSAA